MGKGGNRRVREERGLRGNEREEKGKGRGKGGKMK